MFGIDNNAMEKVLDMAKAQQEQKQSDGVELLEVLKSIDVSLKRISDWYVYGIRNQL